MRSTLIRCYFLQEIMAEGKNAMVSYATAPNAGWLIGRVAYCAIHCNSVHGQLRSSPLRPSETGCGCNMGRSPPVGAGLRLRLPAGSPGAAASGRAASPWGRSRLGGFLGGKAAGAPHWSGAGQPGRGSRSLRSRPEEDGAMLRPYKKGISRKIRWLYNKKAVAKTLFSHAAARKRKPSRRDAACIEWKPWIWPRRRRSQRGGIRPHMMCTISQRGKPWRQPSGPSPYPKSGRRNFGW